MQHILAVTVQYSGEPTGLVHSERTGVWCELQYA